MAGNELYVGNMLESVENKLDVVDASLVGMTNKLEELITNTGYLQRMYVSEGLRKSLSLSGATFAACVLSNVTALHNLNNTYYLLMYVEVTNTGGDGYYPSIYNGVAGFKEIKYVDCGNGTTTLKVNLKKMSNLLGITPQKFKIQTTGTYENYREITIKYHETDYIFKTDKTEQVNIPENEEIADIMISYKTYGNTHLKCNISVVDSNNSETGIFITNNISFVNNELVLGTGASAGKVKLSLPAEIPAISKWDLFNLMGQPKENISVTLINSITNEKITDLEDNFYMGDIETLNVALLIEMWDAPDAVKPFISSVAYRYVE